MRKKYLKKRSSEERQEIIDELRLKQYNSETVTSKDSKEILK